MTIIFNMEDDARTEHYLRLSDDLEAKVANRQIKPTIKGLQAAGAVLLSLQETVSLVIDGSRYDVAILFDETNQLWYSSCWYALEVHLTLYDYFTKEGLIAELRRIEAEAMVEPDTSGLELLDLKV